ncbi:MAG: hypothetical protein M0Q92_02690 [Methanoregula sp.]|jgi:hypothetical protein|nr:hypothetical protein [Methanoregula sp.]
MADFNPEDLDLRISEVWMRSLTGSAFNSMTDPHEDEPVIEISTAEIEQFGAAGKDKINYLVEADLSKLPFKAGLLTSVAWDPVKYPGKRLLYQADLASVQQVKWRNRCYYLPRYKYMRRPDDPKTRYIDEGEHELEIMVQLTNITTNWQHDGETYTAFTEHPRIGDMVTRKIKVIVTE